jgi:hypothetical protein
LIIKTPADVNSVNIVLNVSFKAVFERLKSTLGLITSSQNQQLKNLEVVVQKLGNSATAAITETVLTQGVNKELIESADYQKNRKKASKKEEDKISDARVLSLEMMDEAIRIKAEKKKEAEEKLAKEKRLKALGKQWTSLYNHTLVQLRKWGPEMLQEVKEYQPMEDQLSKAPKASKTPRRKKTILQSSKDSPIRPPAFDDFPDLPRAPAKARSTAVPLPPLPTSPPSAPSPTKKLSPVKKTIRRQAKKTKELVEEIIEAPSTVTANGRRSKRRLFHDELLVNALANQKAV